MPRRAFAYWRLDEAHGWDVAAGAYTVHAGPSSRKLPLTSTVRLPGAEGVQGIAVEAPDTLAEGSRATVTVTLTTNTAPRPRANPSVRLEPPAGWQGDSASPAPEQESDRSRRTYRVRVPDEAGPTTYVLTAFANWNGHPGGPATRAAGVRVQDD
jgi:hypothetical protein